MTTILRLDSSVSGQESVTVDLSALLIETLTANDSAATVVRRDLTNLPVLTTTRFAANSTPDTDRTDEQRKLAEEGDRVITDLETADVLVIGAPIYNFGVPSGVKAWMDLAARAGRTFSYSPDGPKGLLTEKTAYIVSASGGVELGSAVDFGTPHLQQFLRFLGIADITVIDAGGLMNDQNKLDTARDQIRQLSPL